MDLEKTFDAVGPINVDVSRTIIYVILGRLCICSDSEELPGQQGSI